MQYFDRATAPPPPVFRSVEARMERQGFSNFLRQDLKIQAQSSVPSSRFAADTDVLAALDGLFHSKCGFCESRAPLHFHLFRPEAEATPLAVSELSHLYYIWLRTDWGNYYPICESCAAVSYRRFPVRKGRGRLPTPQEIDGFEKEDLGLWRWKHHDTPLLLDPCREKDYAKHFGVDLTGRLQDTSEAGRTTIDVFDLNRDALLRERSDAYRQYMTLLRSEFDRGLPSTIFDFEQLEFGGSWYLLLRRLTVEIARRIERPVSGDRTRLGDALRQAYGTDIGRKAFDEGLETIEVPAPPKKRRPPRRMHEVAGILTAIEVRNFKSLEHLELMLPTAISNSSEKNSDREASSLLILGENATGKSSLLEAVALSLAGDSVRNALTKAPQNFILNPEMMGAVDTRPPDSATVVVSFEGNVNQTLEIRQEFVASDEDLRLPSVFAYGAFRHYGTSAKRARRLGHVGTLFQQDIILPNPESWLLQLDKPRFSMVARALRQILSVESEYELIEPDTANNRCVIVTRVDDEAGGEIRTPFAVASSGYRSVLAMVCDIFEGVISKSDRDLRPLDEINAIILIDEIEAHLHPKWKMQIMSSLRRVFPRSTIIATTHDPLCIRGMHNGEVVVLSRLRNEGTSLSMPSYVEVRTDLPDVDNMTVEQLLTSDLFAMFSTDSAAAERNLAQLGNLLARREAGDDLTLEEQDVLKKLETDIIQAMPLGTNLAQRLVLDAVAEYLDKRRGASNQQLLSLERTAKNRIIAALEGI
ncbi:AAA family ATPase [Rhizobium herbae]